MKRSRFTYSILTLGILAISQAMQPAYAAGSLVYVPVDPPCRIARTQGTSTPSIPADTGVDLLAYGDAAALGPQGGTEDCLNPIPASTPVAIAANVTAVGNQASGNGNVVAYPAGSTVPSASLVNYTTSANIANSTIIALCEGSSCTADFTVRSNFSSVPVLVDVQGYFYPKTLKNVITVSAENGDFTSPRDAINSIPATGADAPSDTNRYVVEMGPGVYDLGSSVVDMRSYVSLIGSGVEATRLQTASPSALVIFNSVTGSDLAAMTVLNTGTGANFSTGVLIQTDSADPSNPHLYDLRIIAEGATVDTKGIQIQQGSGGSGLIAPVIERVDAAGRNPVSGRGIGIIMGTCSDTRLERVSAFGTDLGLNLAANADCVHPILWSRFSGPGDDDIAVNPSANVVIGHSHLENGTMTFGGGTGVTNCVSVTTPTAILNPNCTP